MLNQSFLLCVRQYVKIESSRVSKDVPNWEKVPEMQKQAAEVYLREICVTREEINDYLMIDAAKTLTGLTDYQAEGIDSAISPFSGDSGISLPLKWETWLFKPLYAVPYYRCAHICTNQKGRKHKSFRSFLILQTSRNVQSPNTPALHMPEPGKTMLAHIGYRTSSPAVLPSTPHGTGGTHLSQW